MAGFDMPGDGGKASGAMLAIGELAERIGVPAHVLRYWETRFPQLKPLQRSGRRRYYRAEDVALAERIHHLLHVQGFTVEGARKALSEKSSHEKPSVEADGETRAELTRGGLDDPMPASAAPRGVSVEALVALRQRLAAALG